MRDFGRFKNEFWDTSWHLFVRRPVLTYDMYIEFLHTHTHKKKKQAKRNLMSTLDTRDVLNGISEARLMKVYFYIWT